MAAVPRTNAYIQDTSAEGQMSDKLWHALKGTDASTSRKQASLVGGAGIGANFGAMMIATRSRGASRELAAFVVRDDVEIKSRIAWGNTRTGSFRRRSGHVQPTASKVIDAAADALLRRSLLSMCFHCRLMTRAIDSQRAQSTVASTDPAARRFPKRHQTMRLRKGGHDLHTAVAIETVLTGS